MQSFGIALALQNNDGGFVLNPGPGFILMTMLSLTTGTAFIMWLGEQISERGIGNGISLIIFAGIVVNLPHAAVGLIEDIRTGQRNLFAMVGLVVFMIAVVAFVVFM